MNKIIITIFGATGDLAARKLLPALTNLLHNELYKDKIQIIALGRRTYSTAEYLNHIKESGHYSSNHKLLAKHLLYQRLDIENAQDYQALQNLLMSMSEQETTLKLFYLAVGPDLFIPIVKGLAKYGSAKKGNEFDLLAFEKPFGHDLLHAQEITNEISKHFNEHQIYRVDHYLGKEMIQQLLTIRFGNRIFTELWHANHLKHVKIVVSEQDGILTRGAYYDQVGVLKDMVQSHLLQMVALTALEEPKSLQSTEIKQVKIAALKAVNVNTAKSIFGQYKGYLHEKGVAKESLTPTLSFLQLEVNTPRFKGVPFYVLSGKKLPRKEAYIEIAFKPSTAAHLFPTPVPSNKLIISLAPESNVRVTLNSKDMGLSDKVEKINLDYCYSCTFPSSVKEAYEKLFQEMFNQNKTLFPHWDEIRLAWQIIDQIKVTKEMLEVYEQETDIFTKVEAL